MSEYADRCKRLAALHKAEGDRLMETPESGRRRGTRITPSQECAAEEHYFHAERLLARANGEAA